MDSTSIVYRCSVQFVCGYFFYFFSTSKLKWCLLSIWLSSNDETDKKRDMWVRLRLHIKFSVWFALIYAPVSIASWTKHAYMCVRISMYVYSVHNNWLHLFSWWNENLCLAYAILGWLSVCTYNVITTLFFRAFLQFLFFTTWSFAALGAVCTSLLNSNILYFEIASHSECTHIETWRFCCLFLSFFSL